jgi:hypothetical protein
VVEMVQRYKFMPPLLLLAPANQHLEPLYTEKIPIGIWNKLAKGVVDKFPGNHHFLALT